MIFFEQFTPDLELTGLAILKEREPEVDDGFLTWVWTFVLLAPQHLKKFLGRLEHKSKVEKPSIAAKPTSEAFPLGGQTVRLFGELIAGMVQSNILSRYLQM